MKLIALLIGLIVERLATQLFHLREFRWLDGLIDAGFRQVGRFSNWPTVIPLTLLAILLALPVFLVIFGLGDRLYLGFPYLILAIIVLFFSLGPNDIGEDVDEYCRALEAEDEEEVRKTAKALVEADMPDDLRQRIRCVEEAVCVQANNRLFAVIFWFVLLGPIGAWSYRVTDLIRRRAVFRSARDGDSGMSPQIRASAMLLHGWLAWIPARLTAVGYAMAGSFDGAQHAWRAPTGEGGEHKHETSEQMLARIGVGALALHDIEGESDSERGIRGARAANGMVFRLLFIWAAVIAAMTLYGWSV
jgi:AmpE protein